MNGGAVRLVYDGDGNRVAKTTVVDRGRQRRRCPGKGRANCSRLLCMAALSEVNPVEEV